MSEPHQRVQSGKLRPSKRSNSEPIIKRQHELTTVFVGLESTTRLEPSNSDDSLQCHLQTPSVLTSIHVDLLTKMANGYGITEQDAIDRYWRRTWCIGMWCIGASVSLSVNIMQPNISGCWATITGGHDERVEIIANEYRNENLPRSTSVARQIGVNKGYQLQGRWTLNIVERLISEGIISKDNVQITAANIGQSRIFCWLLIGEKSEYLATLTKDSVELLMKYTPDWCADLKEHSSAEDITLRIKNPQVVNDTTQLVITTTGAVRYQGRIDNISKLPQALSIAIKSIITSRHLITFLESLEYKELPADF